MGGQDGPFLHHHPRQYATNPSSHLKGSGLVFHPLDTQHAPQLDFTGQGSIIAQHRPPSATSGLPEFDRLPPHMQDNLQRHHLMQGFPSGGPPHHHSPNVNNQIPGLIPELNPSQGFPFAHHQPSYGMPPQVLKATELIIQLHRQWVKLVVLIVKAQWVRNLTLVLDTVKLSFEKDEKKKKYLLLAASDVDAFSVQCGFESVWLALSILGFCSFFITR